MDCLKNIDNLREYLANTKTDKIKVITINVGDNMKTANLTLRERNIAFESYQLNAAASQNWKTAIDEEWDGKLPAFFMVNSSEELFLKYYKAMSGDELEAILQTLVI